MRNISIATQAFFDGFALSGLFGKLKRPGAPDYLFAQSEEDEESEPAVVTNAVGQQARSVESVEETGLFDDNLTRMKKGSWLRNEIHEGLDSSSQAGGTQQEPADLDLRSRHRSVLGSAEDFWNAAPANAKHDDGKQSR